MNILLAALLMTSWTAFSAPASVQEGAAVAAAALDSADSTKAMQLFEELIPQAPANSALLYNFGIAAFRANQTGKAMAAFLAARRLAPRDPDVRHNLKWTQGRIVDKLDVEMPRDVWKSIFFWISAVSLREWVWLTCALVFALGIAWSIFLLRPDWPAAYFARWILLAAAVAALGSGALASLWDQPWGAVVAPAAEVRSGPGSGHIVTFQLREGAPFVERGREGNWVRITVSDGKSGWVDQSAVAIY